MDGDFVAGVGYSYHVDGGGGLFAGGVGVEGRASEGVAEIEGTAAEDFGRSHEVGRRHSQSAVCLKNYFVCAGLHAVAGGGEGIWLESEQRRDRADVAGGVHYPERVFGQDQGSVR